MLLTGIVASQSACRGRSDSGATPPVRNRAQALVASGHARSTPMARNQSMSRAGATPNHPHVTRFERGYRRCCRTRGDSTATQGIQAGSCRCRPRRVDTQRFRPTSAAASVAAMVQQCTSSDSSETMVTHQKTLRSTSPFGRAPTIGTPAAPSDETSQSREMPTSQLSQRITVFASHQPTDAGGVPEG